MVKKFLKSSVIYFAGNTLTKLVLIFLLPLYTSQLETQDMGYFDYSIAILNIIMPLACIQIWSAILRFMFDKNEQEYKNRVISNGLLLFLCSFVTYSFSFVIWSVIEKIYFLPYLFIYGIFTMLGYLFGNIARGQGENVLYATSGLLNGLTSALLNIIFIFVFNLGINSLYISAICGYLIQIMMIGIKLRTILCINKSYLSKKILFDLIRFAIPLSVNQILYWFLTSYNKVIIKSIMGLEKNGIYSVASKFAVILNLVASCFVLAWQEIIFAEMNSNTRDVLYQKAINYYLKLLNISVLILIPCVSIIFPFLIKKAYIEAYSLIPLYLLVTCASILAEFCGQIFYSEKKTTILMYSSIAASIVNIIVLHLTIDFLGVQASNIALLVGYCTCIILRILLLRKRYNIKLDIINIALTSILFWGVFYIYINEGTLLNTLVICVMIFVGILVFHKELRQILKWYIKKSQVNK